MAKIVSPVWSSIRGSIAGTTYLTTPSGAIIGRQRVKPTQATSPHRTDIRNSMILGVSAWENQSEADQASWSLWAKVHKTGTGRQTFLGGWTLLEFLNARGLDTLVHDDSPPTLPGRPSFSIVAGIYAEPGGTGVAFNLHTTYSEHMVVFLQLSPMLSPSRNYWKGPWDPAQQQAIDLTLASDPQVTFNDLVADMKYFVRAIALSVPIGPSVLVGQIVSTGYITSSIAKATV